MMKTFYILSIIFALVMNTLELEGTENVFAVNSSKCTVSYDSHAANINYNDVDTGHEGHKDHDQESHRCHLGHCMFGLVASQAFNFPTPVTETVLTYTSNLTDVFLPSLKRPPIS